MTRLSVLLLGIAILSLVSFSEAGPVQRYLHFRKADPPVKLDQPVPFFAELDVSETQYMFDELLSRISGCGVRLEWRSRSEFSGKQQETQQLQGAVLLVATGGPRAEEKEYFKNIPEGQNVVLVHPSDEYIMQSHPATYGEGVKQVFRNYYHVGMGNSSMQYLRQQAATAPTPKVLWMPLGLANLRVMPGALHYPFRERKHLWAWAGSFGDKPERSEMMDALKAHKMSAEVMSMGVLKTFGSYAGRPGSHSDAINIWEYSMLMHQTQFVPIPAGISAEQYRVWESFEAGALMLIMLGDLFILISEADFAVSPSFVHCKYIL